LIVTGVADDVESADGASAALSAFVAADVDGSASRRLGKTRIFPSLARRIEI